MIYPYPFSSYPKNYYPYSRAFSQYRNNSPNSFRPSLPSNSSKLNSSSHTESSPLKKEVKQLEDQPFFELFGIQLYFDDILLICLIFFLYQEGVKDEFLFLTLILLLLS